MNDEATTVIFSATPDFTSLETKQLHMLDQSHGRLVSKINKRRLIPFMTTLKLIRIEVRDVSKCCFGEDCILGQASRPLQDEDYLDKPQKHPSLEFQQTKNIRHVFCV